MADDNPYQVTTATNAAPPTTLDIEPSAIRVIFGWIVVFGINLPVPVLFGSGVVSGTGGYLGMTLGCVLWCGTGILICRRGWAKHIRATSWGGLLVALSQIYPMLQMFAGLAAITIVRVLVTPSDNNSRFPATKHSVLLDLLVASSLTILTGAILISIALVVGHTILFLYRRLRPDSQSQATIKEV